MQQYGRAVGQLAEKIKNNKPDKNTASIFGDAHAAGKLRHSHIKKHRVGDQHAKRRKHRPDPPQHGATEAGEIFAAHDGADELAVTPGALEGSDITLRDSGQGALKTFEVNVYGQRHGKLKPVRGKPCQCCCLYSKPGALRCAKNRLIGGLGLLSRQTSPTSQAATCESAGASRAHS